MPGEALAATRHSRWSPEILHPLLRTSYESHYESIRPEVRLASRPAAHGFIQKTPFCFLTHEYYLLPVCIHPPTLSLPRTDTTRGALEAAP